MAHRRTLVSIFTFTLALALIGAVAVGGIFEGIVVAAGNGSIAITDIYGQNMHSRVVGSNARILLDGTPAKLEEIRMGDHVVLTTRKVDRRNDVVVRIDAHSSH